MPSPPQDAVTGRIILDGREIPYGLSHSEPMERNFLIFLYDDRYIVTIGYMDVSRVNLWDFLENFALKEIPLS